MTMKRFMCMMVILFAATLAYAGIFYHPATKRLHMSGEESEHLAKDGWVQLTRAQADAIRTHSPIYHKIVEGRPVLMTEAERAAVDATRAKAYWLGVLEQACDSKHAALSARALLANNNKDLTAIDARITALDARIAQALGQLP